VCPNTLVSTGRKVLHESIISGLKSIQDTGDSFLDKTNMVHAH